MGASFLNLVTTKVTVKGEEQKFVSLRLHQRFNRHHAFTVIVKLPFARQYVQADT